MTHPVIQGDLMEPDPSEPEASEGPSSANRARRRIAGGRG